VHDQYKIDRHNLEEQAMPCGQAVHHKYGGMPQCQRCKLEFRVGQEQPVEVMGKHAEMCRSDVRIEKCVGRKE
jgi:hypothetical protein